MASRKKIAVLARQILRMIDEGGGEDSVSEMIDHLETIEAKAADLAEMVLAQEDRKVQAGGQR